ncbi:histone-lysine N-methyltransferase SETMAR [Plakobranchus ocellatus]|uniref:Histone-lysine N-methyltransferase SETMAR n=1 Tax=Plakobranchus ocellatus TaxID=259542 RepID=A0AAV3XZI6_9GAST|nr:histone-lysine N-methyltransferase SETMAR [Plakobranchus ocellatus]
MSKRITHFASRYCSTLDRLKEAIRRKRPGLLRRGVVLQHDKLHSNGCSATVGNFFLILPTVQTWHPLTFICLDP